jgi:flagellar motility protein MotE (MotC chaperone)
MDERYSIEVSDEVVEIYGHLTIEEAFDFLSFFDRKGYKAVVLGSENSTLRMMRIDQDEVRENRRRLDVEDELDSYRSLLKKEEEYHTQTKKRLQNVEDLMKLLMSEHYEKYKKLHKENMEILRSQCIQNLSENPESQKIIDNFHLGKKDEKIQE